MALTLGEKLRQAREERGITISEVAEQTRISPLYLESIEENDYRNLPGGIFNKGFIKSFAKYVGVDEQEALQDYSRLIAEQNNGDEEPKTYRPEVLTDDRRNSSMLPTIVFAIIILGLMTWGVLALVSYIQNQPPLTADSNTANTATDANQADVDTTNVNVAPTPAPVTDRILAEVRATRQDLWVRYGIDDKTQNKIIKPDQPLELEAQKTLSLSYSNAQTANIQFTLNGRQIELPPAAARGSTINFQISKENIQEILQNGKITSQ